MKSGEKPKSFVESNPGALLPGKIVDRPPVEPSKHRVLLLFFWSGTGRVIKSFITI
jgi:hypothetical protein